MKQYLILLLILYAPILGNAQLQKKIKIHDSLKSRSYNYLDDKIYEYKKDSSKAAVYMFAYLIKARNEHNYREMVYAYQNILHQSPQYLRIVYADSMIYTAKKSNDNTLIGSAFLSKGIVYYGQKQYEKAYNNYITANNYISKSNDKYQYYKVKYYMAQIKYYLGFYDEAISLFNDCLQYFKDEKDKRAYLNTLHSLAVCYNRIGNYGECNEMNLLGLAESKRLKNTEMNAYFIHSQGINEYFKKNYALAISMIKSSFYDIAENKDFANESVGNFYIGKSFWELKRRDSAVSYFFKVDNTFNEKNYIRPDLREVYELLIDFYKSKKNLKSQLHYIDQLLKADSILINTHKYLIGKIHKEYDTKELIREKEKISEQLIREKYYDAAAIGIITVLFLLSLFLTNRHYKNRRNYKKKYDELMKTSQADEIKIVHKKNDKPHLLDVPQETIDAVLIELEKFKLERKFLAKDLRLSSVAATLGTNSKYLSKILSIYKNKRFIEYFNDLKIDYIIEQLKENKMMRKYTNAALASEAGFSSTQPFVFAFKAKTGMPVHFFIEQINKGSS